MMSGTSAPESYLQVLPHPNDLFGLILVYPCTGFQNYCDGGRLTINAGVPTESTTWGLIKELYWEHPSNRCMQPTAGAKRER